MSDRGDFEYPDEAGYPDGKGFLDETEPGVVADAGEDAREAPGIDFYIVDADSGHRYEAISGDTLLGGITYRTHGDLVELVSTVVFPEFRHQGVATELIRRVLDRLRAEDRRVVNDCPAIESFVERHPEYRELIVARDS